MYICNSFMNITLGIKVGIYYVIHMYMIYIYTLCFAENLCL